jgi:hypothetical protein
MTNEETPMDVLKREYPTARKEAKMEIFRLQLLDEYIVDAEKDSYSAYKNGDVIRYPRFNENLDSLSNMKKNGISVINLLVVDIPLSTYTKYAIETVYLAQLDYGKETFMAERSTVSKLTEGIRDFWLFDNNKVIPMLYDPKGNLVGASKPIIGDQVKEYVEIKERLLANSLPLKEFLRTNNLGLEKRKVVSI